MLKILWKLWGKIWGWGKSWGGIHKAKQGGLLGYYRYVLKDGVTKNMGHNLGQDAKLKRGAKRGVESRMKYGVEYGVPTNMGRNMGQYCLYGYKRRL